MLRALHRRAHLSPECAISVRISGPPRRSAAPAAHLGGDHREAASGLAGARRFDGGVQRQDIGLECDAVDDADDVADLVRDCFEPAIDATTCASPPADLGLVAQARCQLVELAGVAGVVRDRR